jgi:hypothetical protein
MLRLAELDRTFDLLQQCFKSSVPTDGRVATCGPQKLESQCWIFDSDHQPSGLEGLPTSEFTLNAAGRSYRTFYILSCNQRMCERQFNVVVAWF